MLEKTALYLKYRPTKWSDLVGQEFVSQTLSLALQLNKVSHAYLFSGLRGSGKTTSARIFARTLQCEKSLTPIPCEECKQCKASLDGKHADIIEMDAASNRGIDKIRELIENTKYPPMFGRFKIFIIDEVHMLTNEAFNALLKTLEEPPSFIKFILATTDPLKLPVTILSRTQHFRFKKIPQKSIISRLQYILENEKISFEPQAVELLSRNCNGSLRDAISMLEQAIVFCKENITLESLTDMLGALNPSVVDEFFSAILQNDNQKIDEILKKFEDYEAENVLDEMINFLKIKLLTRDARFSTITIERFFRIIGDSKTILNLNADSSFVLLLTTMKLKESLNIEEIDTLISKIQNEFLEQLPNKQITSKSPESSAQESNKSAILDENYSLKFEELKRRIYDRDAKLGTIFANNIKYVNFSDNNLELESNASGEESDELRKYSSVIKDLAISVFGTNAKIKITKTESSNIAAQTALNETIAESSADSTLEVLNKFKTSLNIFDIKKS